MEKGLELRLELGLEACQAGRQDTMSCDSRQSSTATSLPYVSRLKLKAAAFDRAIKRMVCWHSYYVGRAPFD